jgi:hypothetical protein
MADIYEPVQRASNDLCDDAVLCEHEGQSYGAPEWRHQVRWALQDLKQDRSVGPGRKVATNRQRCRQAETWRMTKRDTTPA